MAMGRNMVLVMALAMLAFMVVEWAGYGSSHTAKFASGSLQDVDESVRSLDHEDAADEFLDEPTRRMLATQSYISYTALGANRAPCPSAAAGVSYYSNCATTGTASPYTRSCVQITRCQRG